MSLISIMDLMSSIFNDNGIEYSLHYENGEFSITERIHGAYYSSDLKELYDYYVIPIKAFFEDETNPENVIAVATLLNEFDIYRLDKEVLRRLLDFWSNHINNYPEKYC